VIEESLRLRPPIPAPAREARASLTPGARAVKAFQVSIVALAIIAVGCSAKKPPAPPPPKVVVSKPLQTKIVDWDDYVGRFEAINSVDVRPRVTGYLQSIEFRDGQMVHKGQVLFVIDPRPYQAALEQARGQEAHAVSVLANADIELARAKKLLGARVIAEQEYETRLATEQQAAGDLSSARGAVRTAALNLEFTRVIAPLDGRASDRRVAPGNLVTQDSTILTNITDLDPIYFTFNGAESFYLKYERQALQGVRQQSRSFANPVQIRLQDQADYAIKGHMNFVDNVLDPNSGTIRGRAIVANPGYLLTPGMFGHLRLLGSGTYDGLLIPDEAIVAQQSDEIVFVVAADGEVGQRKVSLGPRIGGLRVIHSGLAADEQVIIDGVQRAKVGLKVSASPGRIVPPNPGAIPSPVDLTPPPASATFPDTVH
jgi:RND family efflux transporter MFP subunit